MGKVRTAVLVAPVLRQAGLAAVAVVRELSVLLGLTVPAAAMAAPAS